MITNRYFCQGKVPKSDDKLTNEFPLGRASASWAACLAKGTIYLGVTITMYPVKHFCGSKSVNEL